MTDRLYAADVTGALSTVYPALADADPTAFGLCVAGVSGEVVSTGAAEHVFTIMSVAKPFGATGSSTSACRARAGSRADW